MGGFAIDKDGAKEQNKIGMGIDMTMDLIEYISLLKNVRGILLFPVEEGPDPDKIKWLIKAHRYRDIGIPPSLYTFEELKKRPFVRLIYPLSGIEDLIGQLAGELPAYILEGIVMSSCYAAPLFILNQAIFELLKPLTIWNLVGDKLDSRELLRHIRIASYALIDFYRGAKEAEVILRDSGDSEEDLRKRIERLCEKRKREASADGKKRFWRIISKETPSLRPLTLMAYFDLLPLLLPHIQRLRTQGGYSILLNITCGFGIEP